MKKLVLCLLLIASTLSVKSQTVVYYDYMEDWNWAGNWWIGTNSSWYTNTSVSAPASAVIVGSGNNIPEADWYVMPNVSLDPNKTYTFSFRLAAQSISNPTHPAAGNDTGDYVDVQVSTDGGVNYTSEVRVRGYGNANWDYNSNATIVESLNGVNDVYTPTGGGDRTNTGDGYSTIVLEIPFGTTNFAVDLYCRVNRPGEEWWIDDIELTESSTLLPVELTSFTVTNINGVNVINWKTASELNSDYYLLQRSTNGNFDEKSVISIKPAAGNSNQELSYQVIDNSFRNDINYYQLIQIDIDGNRKEYGPIAIDNTLNHKEVIKITNLLGQEVDQTYKGLVIEVYNDGTSKRYYK